MREGVLKVKVPPPFMGGGEGEGEKDIPHPNLPPETGEGVLKVNISSPEVGEGD